MNNGENIVLSEAPTPTPTPTFTPTPTPQKEVRLVDIPIADENTALNVMVSFLTLAHKRGAFGIDESAKIWECIRMFQKPM
jgi:hypothetical protein